MALKTTLRATVAAPADRLNTCGVIATAAHGTAATCWCRATVELAVTTVAAIRPGVIRSGGRRTLGRPGASRPGAAATGARPGAAVIVICSVCREQPNRAPAAAIHGTLTPIANSQREPH